MNTARSARSGEALTSTSTARRSVRGGRMAA
jgi:hypothetical protein